MIREKEEKEKKEKKEERGGRDRKNKEIGDRNRGLQLIYFMCLAIIFKYRLDKPPHTIYFI